MTTKDKMRESFADAAKDKADADRYRELRAMMRFTTVAGQVTTMTLSAPIPALEHDFHKDWMSPRFEASVDRTVDAAIRTAKESK